MPEKLKLQAAVEGDFRVLFRPVRIGYYDTVVPTHCFASHLIIVEAAGVFSMERYFKYPRIYPVLCDENMDNASY